MADGWAKQAASEPEDHGVEWRTRMGDGPCRRPPWLTLGAGQRRRSGRKPGRGVSGDISTRDMCSGRKASLTRPQPGRRSARPHGSTSSSPGMRCVPEEHGQQTGRPLLVVRPPENDYGTHQTRDHLFKHCDRWKDKQAEIWARVKEATKRGSRSGAWVTFWRMRCSPAVLDPLRSTYVERAAPPVE